MTSSDEARPNAARIYDYFIGGNHNFAADRAAAEQVRTLFPSIPNGMRMNRWFMHQTVEELSKTSATCFSIWPAGFPPRAISMSWRRTRACCTTTTTR
ncbi:MAG TPA: SAM-dependent methyltransferase [Herpetosiphonaceae bacterium]|nr:SAM-dependent methyltransferase [Herpetosiphonaceae bacterium]